MTPYDRRYRPPFPVLDVTLRGVEESVGPMLALLDTGADATIAPTDLLDQISAPESGWAVLRSPLGDGVPVQRYLISIQVDEITLVGIYAVGDDEGDEIVLGRDVLNKLPIFLDGPAHQTHLLDEATVKRLRTRRPR